MSQLTKDDLEFLSNYSTIRSSHIKRFDDAVKTNTGRTLEHGARIAQGLESALVLVEVPALDAILNGLKNRYDKLVLKREELNAANKRLAHASKVEDAIPAVELIHKRYAQLFEAYNALLKANPIAAGDCWDNILNGLRNVQMGQLPAPPAIPKKYQRIKG